MRKGEDNRTKKKERVKMLAFLSLIRLYEQPKSSRMKIQKSKKSHKRVRSLVLESQRKGMPGITPKKDGDLLEISKILKQASIEV